MKRTEPPPLATWILEHCTPADRDEALAGDLIENYHFGRSDSWYWRQTLSACAIAWLNYLRMRASLLVFALLWSMLAPAWKLFSDKIEDSSIFASTGQNLLAPLAGFAVWTVLNSAFFWAGICMYTLSHRSTGKTFHAEKLRHAFLLAPLVFLPTYGIIFVLGNLYQFYLFVGATIPPTPIGQCLDLGRLENAIRIPYIITMLCALWGAIPQLAHGSQQLFIDSSPVESSTQIDPLALASRPDPFTLKRFLGLMVGAGLVNAMIAAFMLCRLPESHAPTLASLLTRAISYVAVGASSGVVGAWFYWQNPSSPFRKNGPIPFPLFAVVCATGWIWVPSMMLFSEQVSPVTALVAGIGAMLLAVGLRKATFSVFAPAQDSSSAIAPEQSELFAESLYRARPEAQGYVIAICLYAAGWALTDHLNLTAATLCALSAFLFVWKRTIPRDPDIDASHEYKRAALRLALVAIPAILVTVWAMLDGVAHRNRIAEMNAMLAAGNGTAASDQADQGAKSRASAYGLGGYESIILWPAPEKPQIVAPSLASVSPFSAHNAKPLIIRFDGPYWYFQPPGQRPGPRAHQAHGNPLAANIEANNFIPLNMEAVQNLGLPIRLSRCREVQVTIENRDNLRGTIALGLVLTDSSAHGKPSISLGQRTIPSSEPDRFAVKISPVDEVLRFAVPSHAAIRRFDQITVVYLPGVEHWQVGAKVAIEQFQLLPR